MNENVIINITTETNNQNLKLKIKVTFVWLLKRKNTSKKGLLWQTSCQVCCAEKVEISMGSITDSRRQLKISQHRVFYVQNSETEITNRNKNIEC